MGARLSHELCKRDPVVENTGDSPLTTDKPYGLEGRDKVGLLVNGKHQSAVPEGTCSW